MIHRSGGYVNLESVAGGDLMTVSEGPTWLFGKMALEISEDF